MIIDEFFFNIIHGLSSRSDFWDSTFVFFAGYFGYFLILFLFLFPLRNFLKYKFLPVIALAAGLFARYAIVETIRFFFYRARPFVEEKIIVLIEHAPTSSFPSGHASFFFALSTIVFLFNKKIGYLFFAGSFLIGFSRIAAGIHWPSDILIGALIGVLTAWIIKEIICEKLSDRINTSCFQ